MEIKCYFSTLMKYAKALGDAEKNGDAQAITEAKIKHDQYAENCIKYGMKV